MKCLFDEGKGEKSGVVILGVFGVLRVRGWERMDGEIG